MQFLLHMTWRTLALIDFAFMTLLLWLVALLPEPLRRRGYFSLFQIWCRTFVRALDAKISIHHHYAGSLPAQYILIANHPSAFEDIGIPAYFPVTSLAKIEVKDWPIFGRISRAAGTLYVKREDKESRHAALTALTRFLQSGRSLAVYPEGGCRGRRLFNRFQRGAFSASYETGVPVLPVFIHYEAQESFEWQGQSLPQKLWQIAFAPNRRVAIHVFEPIDPTLFSDEIALKEHAYRLFQQWDARFLG